MGHWWVFSRWTLDYNSFFRPISKLKHQKLAVIWVRHVFPIRYAETGINNFRLLFHITLLSPSSSDLTCFNLTPSSLAIHAMAKLPYNGSLRAWQFWQRVNCRVQLLVRITLRYIYCHLGSLLFFCFLVLLLPQNNTEFSDYSELTNYCLTL